MTERLTMTPGRRVALALGTPLALLVIGWTALAGVAWAGQGSYRVNLTIPARDAQAGVSLSAGDVTIGPGTGNQIRVTGIAHYSLIRSHLSWHTSASGLRIGSGCAQILVGDCRVNLTVTIPAGHVTQVSDGAGNITATGLRGQVTLTSDAGDIRAVGLAGRVRIAVDAGNIGITALTGPSLVVKDSAGDITASLATPDVTATNNTGNVTLTFTAVPQRVQITDDVGDVTVVLPPGSTKYQVHTTTSVGNAATDVPTDSTSSHVITVSDSVGNIHITH
jgi:hypothetical protein